MAIQNYKDTKFLLFVHMQHKSCAYSTRYMILVSTKLILAALAVEIATMKHHALTAVLFIKETHELGLHNLLDNKCVQHKQYSH